MHMPLVIALKVKGQDKCHQNLITSRVHHNTYFTKLRQYLIRSFSVFMQSDTHALLHVMNVSYIKHRLLRWLLVIFNMQIENEG